MSDGTNFKIDQSCLDPETGRMIEGRVLDKEFKPIINSATKLKAIEELIRYPPGVHLVAMSHFPERKVKSEPSRASLHRFSSAW